jgi:hypothetical protein
LQVTDKLLLMRGKYLRQSLLCAILLGGNALFAAKSGTILKLKSQASANGKNICLADLIETSGIPARDLDKLAKYCKIPVQNAKTRLSKKDIELHAWAAGVIPEKIVGSSILIERSAKASLESLPKKKSAHTRLLRGSPVKFILKSAHMTIERDAVILADAYPGETVEVRLQGTRRNFKASLIDASRAEAVLP